MQNRKIFAFCRIIRNVYNSVIIPNNQIPNITLVIITKIWVKVYKILCKFTKNTSNKASNKNVHILKTMNYIASTEVFSSAQQMRKVKPNMQIADVIKYEGDNSTFVWKHPIEDFTTSTQLIVHESQEALFFLNGQALDLFGPGRHTLQAQNIPILNRIQRISTDGKTPFHCEVYFINMTEQMAIKWGTDSKVQYMEPTYKFPINIGASGEMSLRVEDPKRLLVKLEVYKWLYLNLNP